MQVLSLFDGISCGMVALERAGIPIERYVAFETDKYAIKVSEKNYPQIEHCGDVFEGDFTQYKGFDLLIGGSPCTYWSIAKKNREITPDGIGGQLFMQYVRALKESGCKWFLYENNYSIHNGIKAFISEQLGVEFIMINSALVSAQSRQRCYWTNIPNVGQPEDKGILLRDILERGQVPKEIGTTNGKSFCLDASYYKGSNLELTLKKHRRSMVAEPIMKIPEATAKEFCEIELGECVDLRYLGSKTRAGRKMKEKSNCLTHDMQFFQYVGTPVRIGAYGKGGQGQRIYSIKGKSVCLTNCGGGKGAKTGLYKIDLPDGEYIIRKLTPIEAERLQTLPDNYTEGISNTQRYKCLGNGWTVDVITHILGGLKRWYGSRT